MSPRGEPAPGRSLTDRKAAVLTNNAEAIPRRNLGNNTNQIPLCRMFCLFDQSQLGPCAPLMARWFCGSFSVDA